MSEIRHRGYAINDHRAKRLRVIIDLAVAVQALIFIGLFFYIAKHANPKGDGMEFVVTMPATFILVISVVPVLSFRREPRRLPLGVLIACVGVILNIAFFLEIVREFADIAAP
jgi:hypothetical protein